MNTDEINDELTTANLELNPLYAPTHQSVSIGKLADALAKAQGAMESAKKASENPFFKSGYADMANVWHAIREPLSKNGLSVIQTTTHVIDKTLIKTTLAHSSGEWISGLMPVICEKKTAQGVGSAITYARRYALMAIVGVAPEDDDGEAAMKGTRNEQSNTTNAKTQPGKGKTEKTVTEKQVKRLITIASKRNWTDDEQKELLTTMYPDKKSRNQLTMKEYDEFVGMIEKYEFHDAMFAVTDSPGGYETAPY